MNQSEDFLSSLLIATDPSTAAYPIQAPEVRSQSRAAAPDLRAQASCEEALVVDERSSLRPAHVVESKLTRMLKEGSLPASHLQMRNMLRAR